MRTSHQNPQDLPFVWEKAEESNRASDAPENRVEKIANRYLLERQRPICEQQLKLGGVSPTPMADECERPTGRMEGTRTDWSQ